MSVQNSTQRKTGITVGLAANLPNPANVEAGQFFFASDSANLYVSKISPTNVHAWGTVAGLGGVLVGDVIGPIGANTLNSTINTTVAWGPTGTMTFTNGLLVSTAKAVQGVAELNLQAATVINHRLTGAGPVLFMVEESTTSLQVGTGDASSTPGDYHYRGPAAVGADLNGSNLFFDAALGTGNTGGIGPLIFRTGRYTGSIIVPVPTQLHVYQEVGRWQQGFSVGVTTDPGFGNIIALGNVTAGSFTGTAGAAKFWSGGVTGQTVGTTTTFFADDANTTSVLPQTIAIQYPVPFACTAKNLYVQVQANNLSSSTSVTIYKNGSSTGITLTIGGTATGLFSDIVHTVSLAAGDQIDLVGINVNGGTGNTIHLAGSIQLAV